MTPLRSRPAVLVLVATFGVGPFVPATAGAQRTPLPAEVDKVFAAFDKPGSPGCALGVVRDGRLVYEHGYGMAELEWSIPNSPATVFNIGSISKQFVAASIVLLSERGKLSLDDDVRKYIPELPVYQSPITIRQLLHHTSGVRDLLELMVLAGKDINTHYRIEEYVGLLARQKELNFAPGSQHLYSNSGYLLLGAIVQRTSGMTLREFAERNIFGPLGMKDTHFHDDSRAGTRFRTYWRSFTAIREVSRRSRTAARRWDFGRTISGSPISICRRSCSATHRPIRRGLRRRLPTSISLTG